VWSASEAGLSTAEDDDLTVYAMNKDAVVVTHDREFSRRRQKAPHGMHIWLDCESWDAADRLAAVLHRIIPDFEREPDVFAHVTATRCVMTWWDLG